MANTGEASDVLIEIKVKTMDSQIHHMHISNQRRVRNLKEDIALLIGIPMEQQHLIYCGQVLNDDQVISSYNVQHGDTLHLVCTVPGISSNGSSSSRPGASHATGTEEISLGTQQEIPNTTETLLSRYLNRIRQEYGPNGTENNVNEVRGIAFNLSAPSQGIPEVEQLARMLSSTRDMLINRTSQLLLDFEGDLQQNLNVNDPRVRLRTVQIIQMLFESLGTYFLQLGRVMMPVSTRLIDIQYDLYLAGLHPDQDNSVSTSSIFSDDLPEFFLNEQASADIRQQNNTELTDVHGEENNRNSLSPSQDNFIPHGDIHVEETATPRVTTENDTENMGTDVSSGPSTVEYRSAHESSIECFSSLLRKIIEISLQQDDVAQSQPHGGVPLAQD